MFSSAAVPMTKGERTRARLRDLALTSFRDRGYDATTVRLIAAEAGVSVGTVNAHFPTKNHLVQELYLQVQASHRAAAEPLLAEASDLVARLEIVFRTGLDQLTPYHPHAHEFLSAAVSPRSPINPLSDESAEARGIVEQLFADAVSGATRGGVPEEFRAALPASLTLGHLLLALFWVYDSSPGQRRTRTLLTRGLKLLRAALPLARVPVLRAPLRELLALVGEVRA